MSLTMAVSIGNIIGSGIYNNSLKINLGEKRKKKCFGKRLGLWRKEGREFSYLLILAVQLHPDTLLVIFVDVIDE